MKEVIKAIPDQSYGIGVLLEKQDRLTAPLNQIRNDLSRDMFLIKNLKTFDIPILEAEDNGNEENVLKPKKAVKSCGCEGELLQNILSSWASDLKLKMAQDLEFKDLKLPVLAEEDCNSCKKGNNPVKVSLIYQSLLQQMIEDEKLL